jgi:hypothetical protein
MMTRTNQLAVGADVTGFDVAAENSHQKKKLGCTWPGCTCVVHRPPTSQLSCDCFVREQPSMQHPPLCTASFLVVHPCHIPRCPPVPHSSLSTRAT